MVFGRSIGTGPAMAIADTPGLAGERKRPRARPEIGG